MLFKDACKLLGLSTNELYKLYQCDTVKESAKELAEIADDPDYYIYDPIEGKIRRKPIEEVDLEESFIYKLGVNLSKFKAEKINGEVVVQIPEESQISEEPKKRKKKKYYYPPKDPFDVLNEKYLKEHPEVLTQIEEERETNKKALEERLAKREEEKKNKDTSLNLTIQKSPQIKTIKITRHDIAYLRFSVMNKEHQDAQFNRIKKFCVNHNYNVRTMYYEYQPGSAYFGSEFYKMLGEIMSGEISSIVIDRTDRIDLLYYKLFTSICEQYNTSVIIVDPLCKNKDADLASDIVYLLDKLSEGSYNIKDLLGPVKTNAKFLQNKMLKKELNDSKTIYQNIKVNLY